MRTIDGTSFLGNSIYGYDQNTKSPIDIILEETSNLYMYGRAFTVLLFLATVIFLGKQLNYKTDNIFITFSTAYLLLTALNLEPSASNFNCYSFLYGFSWSSYLEMLSNPRDLSSSSGWFDDYLDKPNNNAHYVLFVDNNIIRNCWSLLLFLIITTAILSFAILVFKCFSVKRYSVKNHWGPSFIQNIYNKWRGVGYNTQDFDHSSLSLLTLIFFIENSFTALTYYSIVNLFNKEWGMASGNKFSSFKALSSIFITFILLYSILRAYSNRIAGIYCFKRTAIGIILGIASIKGGIDENIVLSILLFIALEVVFLGLRYRYELISDHINNLAAKELKKANNKGKITTRRILPEQKNLK